MFLMGVISSSWRLIPDLYLSKTFFIFLSYKNTFYENAKCNLILLLYTSIIFQMIKYKIHLFMALFLLYCYIRVLSIITVFLGILIINVNALLILWHMFYICINAIFRRKQTNMNSLLSTVKSKPIVLSNSLTIAIYSR